MSLPSSSGAKHSASISSIIVSTCLLLAAVGIIVMGLASLNVRSGDQSVQEQVHAEAELQSSAS